MDWLDLRGYQGLLLDGALITVSVSLAGLGVGLVLTVLGALGRLSASPLLRWPAFAFTTIVRGMPDLCTILLVYFGAQMALNHVFEAWLAEAPPQMSPFVAGSLALGVIFGGYGMEVLRGAIQSIPPGQGEAAVALGMGPGLAIRRIILPQAWRMAIPGLGNLWLVLTKASALVSVVALDELMRKTYIAVGNTKEPFKFYLVAALIYLAITVASSLVQHRLERWAGRGWRRA